MENKINQLKLDLQLYAITAKISTNSFRVLPSNLAYILITELKNSHLKMTMIAKTYYGTIRLKLFKIRTLL